MKKSALKAAFAAIVLLGAVCSCGCDVNEMSTLFELSKPYLGVYECKELRLGDEDALERFENFNLELKYDGSFLLTAQKKEGGQWRLSGEYKADTEKGEITFSSQTGLKNSSFTFPYEKGKVCVDYPLGGRLLHAVFSLP